MALHRGIICVMTKPGLNDLRSIEITLSTVRSTVYLYCRRAWYGPGNQRHQGKVRALRLMMPVPVDDHEMLDLIRTMATYCMDPNRRHQKAPRAALWREVALASSVPPGGGEGGEDTPTTLDMDPLPGLSTDPDPTSTIKAEPAPVVSAPAKPARSSAREPRIRRPASGKNSRPAEG